MTCTHKDLYGNINWCTGTTALPGIRKRIYYIPKHSIVTWPKLNNISEVATAADANKLVQLEGDFVLAADAHWKYMEIVPDESKIETSSQGSKPSKSKLNKLSAKLYSIDEDAAAFDRMSLNDDLAFLVPQKNGKYRLLGNEMFETEVDVKSTTGAKATDAMGTTVEVSVTDVCAAPFYVGEVDTIEGKFSALTGEPIAEG